MNPLIDIGFIQSFREDVDNKTAKKKLREYANKTFGLKLNGQLSFDNMIKDLNKQLNSGPKDESNIDLGDGHTVDDLLIASNTIDGVFMNTDKEPDENLVKQIEELKKAKETSEIPLVDTPKVVEGVIETPSSADNTNSDNNSIHRDNIHDDNSTQSIQKVEKHNKTNVLPLTFKPSFALMGAKPGYYSMPAWIFNWIKDTPDWKTNLGGIGPDQETLLKSYLYYIQRDGQILVKVDNDFRILK